MHDIPRSKLQWRCQRFPLFIIYFPIVIFDYIFLQRLRTERREDDFVWFWVTTGDLSPCVGLVGVPRHNHSTPETVAVATTDLLTWASPELINSSGSNCHPTLNSLANTHTFTDLSLLVSGCRRDECHLLMGWESPGPPLAPRSPPHVLLSPSVLRADTHTQNSLNLFILFNTYFNTHKMFVNITLKMQKCYSKNNLVV